MKKESAPDSSHAPSGTDSEQQSAKGEVVCKMFASLFGSAKDAENKQSIFFAHEDYQDQLAFASHVVRDEAVMKLDAVGKWQKRTIVLLRDKVIITAIKPPAHFEGTVRRLDDPDRHPTSRDELYLVLSDGRISYWPTAAAYTTRRAASGHINVKKCHVRAAGEFAAHSNQSSSPFHGLGWVLEEADSGKVFYFTCENKVQRNTWVTTITKHKDHLDEGEQAEIVVAIPMHEILQVGPVDQGFLDIEGQNKMRSGYTREASRNFTLRNQEHAFFIETVRFSGVRFNCESCRHSALLSSY